MAKIKIVTDSSACLSAAFCKLHDIAVVHLSYTFEGQHVSEGMPEEWSTFYEHFAGSADFPKTSQAPMHSFLHEFERALMHDGYEDVICLTISSRVSGTHAAACTAAKMVESERIFVIDSKGGGSSLKMLVEDTVQRIAAGMAVERVVELAQFDVEHTRYQFTAATLEYLRRGGRISSAMAMLGGILKILPLIELVDGVMTVAERVRGGEKKVIDRMVQRLPQKIRKIGISHVLAPDLASQVAEKLRERFPGAPIDIEQMNPVIGSHLGPGALGIAALYE